MILLFSLVGPARASEEEPPGKSAVSGPKKVGVQAGSRIREHPKDLGESEDDSTCFTLSGMKKAFEDRFGPLSIVFRAVGYYQGANDVTMGGQDIRDNKGPGYALDLELTWNPIATGEFYLRVHSGYGKGADRHLGNILLANLNTIADDNDEYGSGVQIVEAYYTQNFLSDRLYVTIGKTDTEAFIDLNAFANDEYIQFVGKPFVNSPLLDTNDNYLPTLAVGGSILDEFQLVVLANTMNQPSSVAFEEIGVGQNLLMTRAFSVS